MATGNLYSSKSGIGVGVEAQPAFLVKTENIQYSILPYQIKRLFSDFIGMGITPNNLQDFKRSPVSQLVNFVIESQKNNKNDIKIKKN